MADNVGITPGTGATAAADDIGGVLYQRVKVSHGADGSATDTSEAAPLPTQDTGLWWMLSRIYQMLASPRGYDKSLQRQRGTVLVESGTVTTVTTVTTCSTVTSVSNLAAFGNEQPQIMARAMARASWRANVRACIS
jgi:hypothetical protein